MERNLVILAKGSKGLNPEKRILCCGSSTSLSSLCFFRDTTSALAVNPNTNVVYLINEIIPLRDPGGLSHRHALLVAVNGTTSAIMNASIAEVNSLNYDLAFIQNNNRLYTITDQGAVTLDSLTNNIPYTNYVSTEEYLRGAVIDKLTNKLYLRGQTGIFVVSDSGSSVPEFESISIAIVASTIGMVIASQKYMKTWSIS